MLGGEPNQLYFIAPTADHIERLGADGAGGAEDEESA